MNKNLKYVALIIGLVLGAYAGFYVGESMHWKPNYGNFEDMSKQLISRAVFSPGAVFPSSDEVDFEVNSVFIGDVFESVSEKRVIEFECASKLGGYCKVTDGVLYIEKQFRTKIYVCCSDEPAECYIGISEVHSSC